jgi:hypothetical protein
VAFEMPRVVQSSGKRFVLLSIAFEAQCLGVKGKIEARADVVGFVVVGQGGGVLFCFGGLAV